MAPLPGLPDWAGAGSGTGVLPGAGEDACTCRDQQLLLGTGGICLLACFLACWTQLLLVLQVAWLIPGDHLRVCSSVQCA
jgi:hypothetical protein